MMRSLYSGVSGLKVHQTKMDVIGNNISNVNTIGFKSSTVTFADVLYQKSQSATGPNADTGSAGQNAMQIGLGSTVSSIATSVSTSGGSQRTDNPFDIMIEGDGFFVVNNGTGNYFTKAGSFTVDQAGTLCNANGYAVMGWQVDPNDETQTVADTVSALKIMSPDNMYSSPEATGAVYFSGNIDSADSAFDSDTGKKTAFSFFDNLGRSYTVNCTLTQDSEDATLYNVSVTDIVDSEGSSIFTTYDETTKKYQMADGVELTIGGTSYDFTLVDEDTGEISCTESFVLKFDGSSGKFSYVNIDTSVDLEDNEYPAINFDLSTTDTAGDPFPVNGIDVDFSSLTMYANSGSTSLSYTKGNLDGQYAGRSAGNMTGCSVDSNGLIYGVYDNGVSRLLGQIVVAQFANASGLEAVGGSLFSSTQNSGEFDGIGKSVAESGGTFNTGVVEMSNVDLATEFTNMITTQRGFQANSRIITTSDTLLEELINLKR